MLLFSKYDKEFKIHDRQKTKKHIKHTETKIKNRKCRLRQTRIEKIMTKKMRKKQFRSSFKVQDKCSIILFNECKT